MEADRTIVEEKIGELTLAFPLLWVDPKALKL